MSIIFSLEAYTHLKYFLVDGHNGFSKYGSQILGKMSWYIIVVCLSTDSASFSHSSSFETAPYFSGKLQLHFSIKKTHLNQFQYASSLDNALLDFIHVNVLCAELSIGNTGCNYLLEFLSCRLPWKHFICPKQSIHQLIH
jgi:hypothetical protein